MANQTINIRVEDTDIRVAGRRFTDFPAAGTYVNTEKVSANATHIEGLNGTSSNVGSNGKSRRVTLTIIQHSDDDVFLTNAIGLLQESPSVVPVNIKYGGLVGVSPGCIIETEPTRELAADGSPMSVYTLTGTFPQFTLRPLAAPTQLTEDQINAFGT